MMYFAAHCERSLNLNEVCGVLTGDSQLHSMFRYDAKPITCPFPHTYTFSYNRGYGDCAFPQSNVYHCTEDSMLNFRYQACPDIHGSESTCKYCLYKS